MYSFIICILVIAVIVSISLVNDAVTYDSKKNWLWVIPSLLFLTTVSLLISWTQREPVKQTKLEPVVVTDFGDKFIISYSGHAIMETKVCVGTNLEK